MPLILLFFFAIAAAGVLTSADCVTYFSLLIRRYMNPLYLLTVRFVPAFRH